MKSEGVRVRESEAGTVSHPKGETVDQRWARENWRGLPSLFAANPSKTTLHSSLFTPLVRFIHK